MKQNCRAITSPRKRTNTFVFLTWQLRNTWNLKSKFKFQVFLGRQDRKTNLFVHFLGEVMAQQFCLEIHWPLVYAICILGLKFSICEMITQEMRGGQNLQIIFPIWGIKERGKFLIFICRFSFLLIHILIWPCKDEQKPFFPIS